MKKTLFFFKNSLRPLRKPFASFAVKHLKYSIIAILLSIFTASYSQNLKCKMDFNDKFGFVDEKGKIVIPYKYEDALNFAEDLAAVKLNGKWGFIDKNDKIVIPCKYDDAASFLNGLASVSLNNKWINIDKNDKEYTEADAIFFKMQNHQSADTENNISENTDMFEDFIQNDIKPSAKVNKNTDVKRRDVASRVSTARVAGRVSFAAGLKPRVGICRRFAAMGVTGFTAVFAFLSSSALQRFDAVVVICLSMMK